MAEHGVVVAGSDCCIASLGDAGRRRWWELCCCSSELGGGTDSSGGGGVCGGKEGGAEGRRMVQGWRAMRCRGYECRAGAVEGGLYSG